MKDEQDTDKAD